MSLASAYLAVAALVTGGFAVAYLACSAPMARMVGVQLPSASARADYRAIYGGAQLGVGAFFAIAVTRLAWQAPALWALALFAGGFGVARVGSLALDRPPRRDPQWVVGALELITGGAAAWIARGL